MPPARLVNCPAPDPCRPEPGLAEKLLGRDGFVRFYGAVPPRAGASSAQLADGAAGIADRVSKLPLDGLVVYDLQDESGRTHVPRPFPFAPKVDPRFFSGLLADVTGHDTVCFKCIGLLDEQEWEAWLDETVLRGDIELLSLVGRPVTRRAGYPMSLSRAFQIAASHAGGFALGGIAIAERQPDNGGEIRRMFDKQATGCGYFFSQTVYDPETAIDVFNSYARECHRWRAKPSRVVLSFAPCGSARTLAFMKWLGIAIPPAVEDAILRANSPLTRSIELCKANLRRILDAIPEDLLPLGFCVESLSAERGEIAASIDLFHALNEILIGDRVLSSGTPVRARSGKRGQIYFPKENKSVPFFR